MHQEQSGGAPLGAARAHWKQLHDNVHQLSSSASSVLKETKLIDEVNDFMAVYAAAAKLTAEVNLAWVDFFTHLMCAKEAAIQANISQREPSPEVVAAFQASAAQLLELNQMTHCLDEKLEQLEKRAQALDREKADGGVRIDELQKKAFKLRENCNAFRESFKNPAHYKAQELEVTLKKVRDKTLLAELDAFTMELNQASVKMHLNGIDEDSLADLCKKLSAFINDERIPKSSTFQSIADMLNVKRSYAECVDAIIEYFKAQAARYRQMFTVKLNSESSLELVRLLMDVNGSNIDSIAQQIERMQVNWVKKMR